MSETRVAATPIDLKSPRACTRAGVSQRRHQDLSSRDAWALDHITHCPTCGAWEMVSDDELTRRCEPSWSPSPWCAHVDPRRVVTTCATS